MTMHSGRFPRRPPGRPGTDGRQRGVHAATLHPAPVSRPPGPAVKQMNDEVFVLRRLSPYQSFIDKRPPPPNKIEDIESSGNAEVW